MNRWVRRARRTVVAGVLLGGGVVAGANAVVITRTGDDVTADPSRLEHAQVAIVPSSFVHADGTLGRVVQQRLDAAVQLYRAGTVDKILVSGDNGTTEYDEPDAMRRAALEAGVRARDVFTDYAGFNTWHTMRRAHDVFQVETAIVVTQDHYVARSVDLAHAAGIDVQGFVAGSRGMGYREVLARVRGLGEATIKPDVTGGATIPITGDGRDSWAIGS